jgi:non-specific protein-tyrosine kinase
MELRQYYLIVRRWLWLILLCTVLGAGSAFFVSTQTTPVYEASATLLIQQAPSGDGSDYQDILTSERLARTYSEMISGRPVMQSVIDQLGLAESPNDLAKQLTVELVRDTQLIRLKVEDENPHQAARIADAVAQAFVGRIDAMQDARYTESMASLQEQMDELSTLMEETEAKIDDLEDDGFGQDEDAEIARLENILAGYRNTYSQLVQNYEELRVTAARSTDDVVLFEEAEASDSPVRPRTMMNTALAAVVGAMLGVGTAFLIEYLDDTVRTPDDVQSATGLSVLGAIGEIEDEGRELVMVSEPLSPVAEAFRKLRSNVEFLNVDRPLRTLLVTSASPMEGKTLISLNLAAAMAQSGKRTVLVEADLRRPRVAPVLKLSSQIGLTHALLERRLDGKLQTSGVERLRFLAAGETAPNPPDLLGSDRMGKLLEQLAEDADVVIIDSPPVLPVADSVLLAPKVDGVVLLVDVAETTRTAAEQAAESLRRAGANLVGVVLNNVPANGGYGSYYYYHGYGYESYHGDSSEPRKRSKGPIAAIRRVLKRRT